MKMRVDDDEDEHSTMNWRKNIEKERGMKLVTGWLDGWIESNTRIEKERKQGWRKREKLEKRKM